MLSAARTDVATHHAVWWLACRSREAAASDEQQLRTPEDGRIAQLTTKGLVTRINSLLYIEENLPVMEKIVQDRSASYSLMLSVIMLVRVRRGDMLGSGISSSAARPTC